MVFIEYISAPVLFDMLGIRRRVLYGCEAVIMRHSIALYSCKYIIFVMMITLCVCIII